MQAAGGGASTVLAGKPLPNASRRCPWMACPPWWMPPPLTLSLSGRMRPSAPATCRECWKRVASLCVKSSAGSCQRGRRSWVGRQWQPLVHTAMAHGAIVYRKLCINAPHGAAAITPAEIPWSPAGPPSPGPHGAHGPAALRTDKPCFSQHPAACARLMAREQHCWVQPVWAHGAHLLGL